jgi:O-antigen ligase
LLEEIPTSLFGMIYSLKKWVEPFIIFFVIFNIIGDTKTCKKVFFGLVILLLVSSLITPLASLQIISFGSASAFQGRAAGFGDSNQFAAFLVLLIPLMLTFSIFHKSYALRTCSAVVLFAAFIALIFGGSRGGILALLVSIFFYLLILYRQKIISLTTFFSVIVIVFMLGTASFVATPSKTSKTVLSRLNPTKSESIAGYSSGRLTIWLRCIKLFAEKPILGHGFYSIVDIMDKRFGEPQVAHNQFLNYLVELGIIGFILYTMIFIKVFHIMWLYQKTTTNFFEKKLYISYIAGLIGYTSTMLFVNLSLSHYIFWFYTAVFLRYGQLQKIGEESKDGTLGANN